MAMSINSLERPQGPSVFYEKKFIRLLESYMDQLRVNNSRILAVDPHDVYKFEGDYFGLLKQFGIENHYFNIVMRVNNGFNPMFVDEETATLLIPSPALIESALQLYKTKSKKSKG